MSGLLDAYAAQADTGAANPLQVLPRTAAERWSAEMDAAMAPDRAANIRVSRFDWFQKTIDQLHDQTGQTFLNPYSDRVSNEELEKFGNQDAARQDRLDKVIQANRALRETNPDAINAEGIDTFIGVAGQAAREKAASYVGTGNGLAAFAAGMMAPQPENIVGLLIPPSRFLTGATATAKTFLGGLGREALYQGGTMGALSATTEALDTASRSETDTAPTLSESAANVGASVLGGALFGGAFHALHAGPKALFDRWNNLHPEVQANAPQEVKDAFSTLQNEALYGNSNRFGIPWDVHDQLQTDTLKSILNGTPIRPLDTPDTAMTALSTILRQPTDSVDLSALQGIVARTTGLADSDIEAVARELKPQSFAAVDAIDQKLQALDQRVQAIHDEAQQIGVPDVIDMDTASILNDIEQRLQAGGLRRQVRQQLEHERAQWLQTLDVHGGLTNELQRMRTEFFPEHGPALQQIAQEREGLMRDRERAQQEAQRETDFLKSKLEQIRLAKPEEVPALTADMAPAPDLANALDRVQISQAARDAAFLRRGEPRAPITRETLTPEAAPTAAAQAPELDVSNMLKASSAKDVRTALMQELEQHEVGVKEAAAVKACVVGAAA